MKQSLLHAVVRRLRGTLWGLFALCMGLLISSPLLAREPSAPTSPTISVTKTDSLLIDGDSDSRADPGDTIRYDLVIRNNGTSDATGVTFSDTIDPLTTLVGGSLKVSPLARNDSYATVGNTLLTVGTSSSRPHVAVSGSLFANDTDFAGDPCCTLDVFDATSTQGGTVAVNPDGTFTYLPPQGFTGTDTFTYRLVDTSGLTGTATVSIVVSSRVWYIDSAAATNGDGRSTTPYNTMAAVQGSDLDGSGDTIYLFSSLTPYAGGITLEASQHLIGGGVPLVINTVTLHPAGTKPTIVNSTANAAGAGVNLAGNNTVRGVTIGDTAQAGINGTNFGTLTVNDTIITGTGRILTLDTGVLAATFESLSTTSSATGISLTAVGGTLASPSTSITGSSTGIGVQNSTSGANFNFGTTTITASTVAINLNNNTGSTIGFANPVIVASNGTGISALGGGTIQVTGTAGTITATNGAAINASGMNFNAVTFASASSTNSVVSGLTLGTMSGSLTINGGSISNPAANGIVVDGGSSTVVYAGSISLTTAGTRSALIQNRTGGTITLSGAHTNNRQGMLVQNNTGGTLTMSGSTKTFSTGASAAVTLLNNTGATINFTGGNLDITTTTGRGFDASGGGTVTVTGSANRIAASGNVGLSITDTTIGGAGVTFERISASNASNGIVLDTTGAGAFTVTGIGTINNSGGTIQSTTRGVNIDAAANVWLENMLFTNAANTDGASQCDGVTNIGCNGAITVLNSTNIVLENVDMSGTMQEGVNANNVTGLSVLHSSLTSCGNNVNEGCLRFVEVDGTVRIVGGSFTQSGERNAWIQNSSGTLNLQVNTVTFDNTFASATGADNMEINLHGTAIANVDILNSSFNRAKTNGLQVLAQGSSIANVDITGSTFDPQGNPMIGMDLGAANTAKINFNITNNPLIAGVNGSAINMIAFDQSDLEGRINNNSDLRSSTGSSNVINLIAEGSSSAIVEINQNVVTTSGTGDPIVIIGRIDSATRVDSTITNNTITMGSSSFAGIRLQAQNNDTVCGDVRSNSVSGTTAGNFVFRARTVDATSRIELEGFTSNVATTWNNNGNTPGGGATSQSGSGTFVGGTCAMPTNPTTQLAINAEAVDDVLDAAALPVEVLAIAQEQRDVAQAQLTDQLSSIAAPVVGIVRQIPSTTVTQATTPIQELGPIDDLETLIETQAVDAGENVNISIGTLGPNEQVLVRFDVTVGSPVPAGKEFVTNQAVVSGSNFSQVFSDDPDTGTASDPTLTPLDAAPNLGITKSDGNASVAPGGTVAYTLSYGNTGTQHASGVVLTETVPLHTSFNPGASTGGWVCAPNNTAGSTCTLPVGALTVGASGSATFAVTVVNPVDAGVNQISNTAAITDDLSSGADPVSSNNSATDTTPVNATPDFTITKTDGGITGIPGQTVVYTLTYANVGNQHATGVVISETVPANTTFNAGASTSGWSCTPNNTAGSTCTFAVGNLAVGTNPSITFAVDVSTPFPIGVDQISNMATIADDGNNGADPTPANNTGSDTTPINAEPDLSITKTDGNISVAPNGVVTYTLGYANNGYRASSNVVITDTVPLHTTFVAGSSTAGWSCADGAVAGTVCTFTVGNVAVGTSGSVLFAVRVIPAVPSGVSQITNTALIGDDGSSGPDMDTSDNDATDTTPVNAAPELSITKDDGRDSLVPGQTTVYTLTVRNNGNQAATGVTISETVPEHTTFTGAGWTCVPDNTAGSTCTTTVGALAPAASEVRTFAVTVDSSVIAGVTTITNTATVIDDLTNGEDPTPANNTATDVDGLVAAPDLTITKTDGGITAVPGQTVVYTLIFTNTGNQNATGVVLSETVPDNSIFNPGSSTPGWVCAPNNNAGSTCTLAIGAVAVESGDTVTFAVTVASSIPLGVDELSNTASVDDDGSNGEDPTPGNNDGSDTTPIDAEPDLAIGKSYEGPPVVPGSTIPYDLNILNNGYRDATNVVITETVPVHTTFNATLSTAGWSCANGAVAGTMCTFDYGTLTVGASESLTFAVDVIDPAVAGADEISNTASIGDDGAGGVDPNPSDNSETVTTPLVATPDIAITKTDNRESVVPGQTTVYTLTVSNQGDQNATGVMISEIVPLNTTFNAGLSSPGWSCPDGSTAGISCILSVGNLNAGTDVSRLFAVSVITPVPSDAFVLANTVTADDDGTNGTEPTPSDNTATDYDDIDANADLSVTKTDGGITAVPGQTVVYTLTVSNVGDRIASEVVLTDTVPLNTTFNAGMSSPGWSCPDGSVGGTVCSFNVSGLPTTANFAVTVANPVAANVTQIVNTAGVTADPNLSNNLVTETTPLQVTVDVAISKRANPTLVTNGQALQYTINFTVTGNTIINNLRITDTLPSEVSFVSALYNGQPLVTVSGPPNFVWAADNVNPGATGQIVINGTANVPTNSEITFTNTAHIGHWQDGTPANNTSSAPIETNLPPTASAGGPYSVNEGSPLTLSAAGSSDPGNDIVSYAWDLDNDGQFDDATGVTTSFNNTTDGPASFTVGVRVTDDNGVTSDATAAVTVNNVAPTVNVGPDRVGRPNVAINFTGIFTDPGTLDTHTITWDFGDGNTATGTLNPSHAYPSAGSYTVLLTVTDKDGGVGTDTLTVNVTRYQLFLPYIARPHPRPDLIVESVTLAPNDITVVIRNIGNLAVTDPFWVDLYLDPHPEPKRVNQIWMMLSDYGAAWGVGAGSSEFFIHPNETVTLHLGDEYFDAGQSELPATIPVGTKVFVQVDSANAGVSYGAVLESHEELNQPYNNIVGPYTTTAPIVPPMLRTSQPAPVDDIPSRSNAVLPPRKQ